MTASPRPEHIRDEDIEFYERELASFIPDRVFDAHVHLWHPDHFDNQFGDPLDEIGYDQYKPMLDVLYHGRELASLFLPWPYPMPDGPCDETTIQERTNAWIAQETAKDPQCRGTFLVTPDDDPEWVRQEVRRLKLHGFKCYHTWAKVDPTWEADIPDYLPEPLVKVADDEGWVIVLHMVKTRAVADPANIHWIRHYCETYPNMKLILAHSARGHQPSHNLEGLPQLTGLDNLYFDNSAVCEPVAHQAVLRIIGHDKLMNGSDFLGNRGRSLGVVDSFLWLYGDTPVWEEKHKTIRPVHSGLETLRSLKFACWSERLSDSAVEDIFWNNAAKLFGLQA